MCGLVPTCDGMTVRSRQERSGRHAARGGEDRLPGGQPGNSPLRKAHLGTRAGVVSKAFVVAAVVALVGALTASPPDTERPDPRWYVETCAEVATTC